MGEDTGRGFEPGLSLHVSMQQHSVMEISDDRTIEQQLELQLAEQRESLRAINEALDLEPEDTELLSVHGELVLAIKDAEEGLLHLKRARLLLEADSFLSTRSLEGTSQDAQVEPFVRNLEEIGTSPAESYSVGSKCSFRHTDGRWYSGHIIALDNSSFAKISFLTPTSEDMVMCKFFLLQRCRFGSSCRMSHGLDIPISSLKPYVPTMWQQSLVGSSILALADGHGGLWREAELDSWDDELCVGEVVFRDDGSSTKLGSNCLALSEYAEIMEEEEKSSEGLDSSSEGDSLPDGTAAQGLGFLESTASQCGVQNETIIFAKWEHHTRGIASKMMAGMGYRKGMGLGISGQGIIDPVSVKVLPPKKSLGNDVISSAIVNEISGRKHGRGGKRKREKKLATVAHAANAGEEQADVFSFINNHLMMQKNGQSRSGKNQREGYGEEKKEDRRSLVAYEDEVKMLRSKVVKLEEMARRNQRDKMVFEMVTKKLEETRMALASAETVHVLASNAVVNKEKEKRWLKF